MLEQLGLHEVSTRTQVKLVLQRQSKLVVLTIVLLMAEQLM